MSEMNSLIIGELRDFVANGKNHWEIHRYLFSLEHLKEPMFLDYVSSHIEGFRAYYEDTFSAMKFATRFTDKHKRKWTNPRFLMANTLWEPSAVNDSLGGSFFTTMLLKHYEKFPGFFQWLVEELCCNMKYAFHFPIYPECFEDSDSCCIGKMIVTHEDFEEDEWFEDAVGSYSIWNKETLEATYEDLKEIENETTEYSFFE